ncbi:MAG: histone deacetylase [Acidobacteriota bacterium]|nr:histone deacetylase [Acidobacteriota bacterium]
MGASPRRAGAVGGTGAGSPATAAPLDTGAGSVLKREWRKLRLRFHPPPLDLIYSERYIVDLPGHDPHRGERILNFLDSAGLVAWRTVHPAPIATFRDLRRVHTDAYLDSLDRPDALLPIVGFDLPEHLSERVVEAQQTMAGGTLLASRLAMRSGGIAANLGGGLHHAFAGKGERLCVFNDIATAIADLRAAGSTAKVLVVDLDLHDGDGTRSIFARDPTVHTFSIHNRTNSGTEEAVETTLIELGDAVADALYLDTLRTRLPPVLASFRPDLVFYVAGCDPAADDQIGNWKISAAGLYERDRFVLSEVRGGSRRLPLVIVLAGGYGRRSWRYSARFLSALLHRGRPIEPPSTEESTLLRYRRLARELEDREPGAAAPPRDAQDDELFRLSDEDIYASFGGPHRPRRLLGAYSQRALELALERAGLLEHLRTMGFERPTLALELDNPAGDTVRMFGDAAGRELLLELRVHLDRRQVAGMTLLSIEWLLLQNPRGHFSLARPRLPGQRFPGLGMLQDVMAILLVVCEHLQLDGIVLVPGHFHTAAQGKRVLRFLNPEDQGVFLSLLAALEGLTLPAAARAVEEGRVYDRRTGTRFTWKPRPMVVPVGVRLRAEVTGQDYGQRTAAASAAHPLALTPEPGAP